MLVALLMLGLLVGLFFACAGLVRFAESIIGPQAERPSRHESSS
jgi:hypothetical protein